MSTASLEEVRSRLKDPAVTLVNVLPRVSFEDGHIPGSMSLPLEEIPTRARELLPDPDREIIAYCAGPT